MADKQYILTGPRNSDSIVLDSCCCCVPLKTGCLILGYLQLVPFILTGLYLMNIVESFTLTSFHEEKEYLVLLIVILIYLITLSFTIVLLVGLHKDNRKYIKIYLIFFGIFLIIYIVSAIALFIGGYGSVHVFISLLISIALNIYFFLVFRSHYIKLGWEDNTNMGYHHITISKNVHLPQMQRNIWVNNTE